MMIEYMLYAQQSRFPDFRHKVTLKKRNGCDTFLYSPQSNSFWWKIGNLILAAESVRTLPKFVTCAKFLYRSSPRVRKVRPSEAKAREPI